MLGFDHSRDIAEPIPQQALLLLVIGLILVSLPFLGSVPNLAHVAVLALAIWRYRIQITGGRLPPAWMRIALFLVAVVANFVIFGTLLNMEAATFLLLVLVGLKVLEMRSSRDFCLVAYLSTFLVLAALFFTSNLPLFLYQLFALLILISSLVMLSAGVGSRLKLRAAYGRTLLLLLQAFPVIVLLYLFFPRLDGGPFRSPLARQQAVTGMSDSMSPGTFASLVRSEEPVMRVSFPQGEIPRRRNLYWRGQVFWDCDAFAWEPGAWLYNYTENLSDQEIAPPAGTATVLQSIILEPHNNRWIYALDRPVSKPIASWSDYTVIKTGQYIMLRGDQRVRNSRQYDVISHASANTGRASRSDIHTARQRGLDVPGNVPENLTNLAWRLVGDSFDPEAYVRKAFVYLAEGNEQSVPGEDVIEQLAAPWREGPMSREELLESVMQWAEDSGWNLTGYNRKMEYHNHIWSQQFTDAETVLEDSIAWFEESGFLYTTSPGIYPSGWRGVEEFLLERRRGFCEHYAGAFAALMRLTGVPARVVVGYQGGTYNRLGNHLLVRQSDAHAWAEVFLGEKGWQRVDLTSHVASDRIDFGMEAWTELERVGPTSNSDRVAALTNFTLRGGFRDVLRNIEFAWDAADYYWNVYILSYDETTQMNVFNFLNLGEARIWKMLLVLLAGLLLILTVLVLIVQWVQRPKDVTAFSRDYRAFLQKLQRHGLTLSPTDGPKELSDRAQQAFPGEQSQIAEIFNTYIRAVYSPRPLEDEEFRQWQKQIRAFRHRRGK